MYDKVVHAGAYCILTLSWLLALNNKVKSLKSSILILILIFIYGIIIELLQGVFTSDRNADLLDIIANTVGILIAIIVFKSILKKNKLFKKIYLEK